MFIARLVAGTKYAASNKYVDPILRIALRHRKSLCAAILVFVGVIYAIVSDVFDPHPDVYKGPRTLPEHNPPGFYDWTSKSAFSPIRSDDAMTLSTDALCAAFPNHLLADIQPVLKTGYTIVDDRLGTELQTTAACLENLLIYSDLDEQFDGHPLVNVIKDIPSRLIARSKELKPWRELVAASEKGLLTEFPRNKYDGWAIDKYKFLAGVSRTWHERPGRKWYVFFEGDTYIVWDTVFRLLEHFDPDEPLYFGSPTIGRGGTFFANGGPGFILSREAMRRLVADDYTTDSQYRGSILTEEEWRMLEPDCCGDSVLGWALAKRGVLLSGLHPLTTPHAPDNIPFSERLWCQPVMTFHRTRKEDAVRFWRWESLQRREDRPMVFQDVALEYHNITSIARRENWDNGALDTFPPPKSSKANSLDPHESAESCASACEANSRCLQWNYHFNECAFSSIFRMGTHRDPERPQRKKGWWARILRFLGFGRAREQQIKVLEADSPSWTYTSGWDLKAIQKWADDRPCEHALWVKPSVERRF